MLAGFEPPDIPIQMVSPHARLLAPRVHQLTDWVAPRLRLLKIEGIDLQACGGTHVSTIGEIGAIRVTRIRNEGKRNKRVELVLAGGDGAGG